MEVSGKRHADFSPGKEPRYRLYTRLGLVWMHVEKRKSSVPTGVRTPKRPASRYTDYDLKQLYMCNERTSWMKSGKNPQEMHLETVKSNVAPVHFMKAYGQSRGIAPLIFNPRTRWGWWSSSCPGRFTNGGSVPIHHLLRGWVVTPASLDALKNSIPITFRESNHSTSVIQPAA
jgi:hypothetical protein